MPTLNWEQMREGVDDYRYLYVLEQRLAAAKQAGQAANAVAAAEKFLADLRAAVPVDFAKTVKTGADGATEYEGSLSAEQLTRMREDCAGHIEALLEAATN